MRLVGPLQIFLEYSSHKGPTGSRGTPDTVRGLCNNSHIQKPYVAGPINGSGANSMDSGLFC